LNDGILLFFIIYGIFYAMIDGIQRAFHTSIGIVAIPGGLIAGLLWDRINPEATFIYGFVLSILSIGLFIYVMRDLVDCRLPTGFNFS